MRKIPENPLKLIKLSEIGEESSVSGSEVACYNLIGYLARKRLVRPDSRKTNQKKCRVRRPYSKLATLL